MPEGISLHVGLNRLDPSHYGGVGGGWEGSLRGCEQDAIDLQAVAAAERFTVSTLLTEAATAQAVTTAVGEGTASLEDGDMFVVTFSGYGGYVPDRNSDRAASESTWALYDRQMPEDELMSLLASFRPSVRVLVIDDSSQPTTVSRAIPVVNERSEDVPSMKALPHDVVLGTYRSNQTLYDSIQNSCTSSDQVVVEAAVVIATGSFEDQLAMDGPRNGLFTQKFLQVWDGGRFRGNYDRFVNEIAALMPATQTPYLTQRGSGKPFVRQRPLTI